MNENYLKGLVNSFLEYYNGNGFHGIRRFGDALKKQNPDSFYTGMIDLWTIRLIVSLPSPNCPLENSGQNRI